MVTKQNIYDLLILFTLISFGFFGSLSHVFTLALVILFFYIYISSNEKYPKNYKAIALFSSLTLCFFLFFICSVFRSNAVSLLISLSPMLPLPLIGLLIIFHSKADIKLSSKQVAKFSQASILFALFVYLILSTAKEPENFFYRFHTGRLYLFSGNPIPFAFSMSGVSLFCLADWKGSKNKNKIIALTCFIIGIYFSGFLSGTRGTLLSLTIIAPFIFYFLSNNFKLTLVITLLFAIISLVLFFLENLNILENAYLSNIISGLETLIFQNERESSVAQRIIQWSAAMEAISEVPLFGYGVTERFFAIKVYLSDPLLAFSHPHNDILASIISVGYLGGFAALLSLMSGFTASLVSPNSSSEKFFFGLMVSILVMVSANVSTVFFNDITSAWLAFSTYLIWATNFEGNKST